MARDTHTYTLIEGMWSHATQTTSECGLSEDGHETRSEQPQCIEVLCICAAQDTQHILEDKKTLCSSKNKRRKIDFRFTHKGTLVEAVTQSHGRKEKKTQDDCFRLETAKICGSEGLGDLEDIYSFYRSEK